MTISNRPLLSAQEAAQQLRHIVGEFFSWTLQLEDGHHAVTRLLVRSPPGLGKTREALDWAAQYQTDRERGTGKFGPRRVGELLDLMGRSAVFVPRHALAAEVKEVIERSFAELGQTINVPILRGRDHDAANGNAPCRRWQEARTLGEKGLPVYSNLCQRRREGETSECPHFSGCEYIRSWRDARQARFIILVHAYLGLAWDSESYASLVQRVDYGEEEDTLLFNPTEVRNIICDEDPSQSLVEAERVQRSALRSIAEDGLGGLILEGLDEPAGLLSYMRSRGVTSEQLRIVAESQSRDERSRGRVADPDKPGGGLDAARPLVRLSQVLKRLADELETGREGQAYSLIAADEDRLIAQGRRRWPFQQRLLLLDGTASPEILWAFVPDLAISDEIRIERNARVMQVTDRTFYRGRLLKSSARHDPDFWQEICAFINTIAGRERTLVVTNKRVRCQLTGEDPDAGLSISAKFGDADVAHFGNLRGSNEFKDHDTVIILGRDEPSVAAAEQRAMAIWYDTKEPIARIASGDNGHVNYPKKSRPYTTRDNSEIVARVSVHPDPRVQGVIEQAREAEMLQAIDRLRLIHSEKRKTVYILCSIPLDLPVDELVTWNELIVDRRLADALAQCDARGWDALPLAAKTLNEKFPELWRSRKAAQSWFEKKPLERSRDIIRLWGLFEYLPTGQKRWSRALIRAGVADGPAALGSVLGISPECLRVRSSGDAAPSAAAAEPQPRSSD